MKILHICLCGPVTDHWSYQENILPKYHKCLGHDVGMITSKFIWNDEGKITADDRSVYLNEYGIKTIRVDLKYRAKVWSPFKKYNYVY